ncbi:MAG: hypothetical protein J2P36_13255 [Ktedonobacteraceae bacterium]|nr:hypothetical protein [Ktedonobacteraceae bacterium]
MFAESDMFGSSSVAEFGNRVQPYSYAVCQGSNSHDEEVRLSWKQLPERLSLSPNEGIWRSGKNGLAGSLAGGTIFGLIIGLGVGQVRGPVVGVVLGSLAGAVVGLLGGLVVGLEAFVKHFILRFFLSRRDDLPWNLVPFLDDMAGRLLLQKVGGNYIFIHRLLLDYFAALDEPVSTRSTSPLMKKSARTSRSNKLRVFLLVQINEKKCG